MQTFSQHKKLREKGKHGNAGRENLHTLLMLFYLVVDQAAATSTMSAYVIVFFMFTLKNNFMLKNHFFLNLKSYMFLKHILIVLIVK